MANNNFKPFAVGVGNAVSSQSEYETSSWLTTGFPPGILQRQKLNKVLRQATLPSAALAQVLADVLQVDVLDDGDVTAFATKLRLAFGPGLPFSTSATYPSGSLGEALQHVNSTGGSALTQANLLALLGNALMEDQFTIALKNRLNQIDAPTTGLVAKVTALTTTYGSTAAAATSASQAAQAVIDATAAKNAALVSQGAAFTSQTTAASSATTATTAAGAASTSATAAATSATSAAGSASSASTSATTAANSATAAGTSATAASTYATSASTSATTAGTAATSATTAANTATTQAASASTSATSAAGSSTTASGSASTAGTAALAAANSATSAANQASAAAGSASTATTAATAAGTSASAAQSSAVAAASSAGSASSSASQAASSATTATGAVSTATTAATTAATAATTATNQATAANTSASSAAASASSAGSSATSASQSASAASSYYTSTVSAVGSITASVTAETNARVSDVSGLNNRLTTAEANYTLKVGATRTDGKQVIAGIGLASQAIGNASQSEVLIQADKLVFVPSSDPNAPLTNLFVVANINGVNTLQIPSALIGSINANQITTGTMRGVYVASSSYIMRGSVTTAVINPNDSVVNLDNTSDFPASGVAVVSGIITPVSGGARRPTEVRLAYTGKTANTLTGITGMNGVTFSFPVGTAIVPGQGGGSMVMDQATNELRVYGDILQDGTSRLAASIGLDGTIYDTFIMTVGSAIAGSSKGAALFESNSGNAITANSTNGYAIAVGTPAGLAPFAVRIGSGNSWLAGCTPLYINASYPAASHIQTDPYNKIPSGASPGALAVMYTAGGGVGSRNASPRLMYCDTDLTWKYVFNNVVFTG